MLLAPAALMVQKLNVLQQSFHQLALDSIHQLALVSIHQLAISWIHQLTCSPVPLIASAPDLPQTNATT